MFDHLKSTFDQIQTFQRLMKDENVKALLSHPKVQEVFQDPEFQKIVMEKNLFKIGSHPKFAVLMQDPEVRNLVQKLNLGDGKL